MSLSFPLALLAVCLVMVLALYVLRPGSVWLLLLELGLGFAALALGWRLFELVRPLAPYLYPGPYPAMLSLGLLVLGLWAVKRFRGWSPTPVILYTAAVAALYLALGVLSATRPEFTIPTGVITFAAALTAWWALLRFRPDRAARFAGPAWAAAAVYLLALLFFYERVSLVDPGLGLAGLFAVFALVKGILNLALKVGPLRRIAMKVEAGLRGLIRPYLVRRLFIMIPTLFGITVVTFFVAKLTPGDPALMRLQQMQGGDMQQPITPAMIEQYRELYGWDKPVPVQYRNWFLRAVRLDFGDSHHHREPVMGKILEKLPNTIILSALSIILTYIIAVPLGIFSATRQNTPADYALTILLFALYSLPSFFAAMLLLQYLSGGEYLNLFPLAGLSSLLASDMSPVMRIFDTLWHAILPVACLTYGSLAALSRYQRGAMLEVIRQDYIRTARAKGLPETVVIYKHAVRNALIPILTLMGYLLPELISGAVIIEQIFSIDGMGKLGFDAILTRDIPLVMGILTISAFLTLVGILLSDILYSVVDPRIRLD